ncbi:ATP-binding protein [Dokdonia sinensis]|uniref:ATP-binding protein n=1 Tax=Dokdonia sinensis TaxID=2479847 RepID=A0A3M0G2A7_9FLAO|nr:ATP-binding protein [Dokdonia sinensis]RMB59074.1 ATP-binding protein [Dokdonia sinensis]
MIHFIFGNTGAGKTTYAQKLWDEQGAIVFSIDEWNNALFIPDKTENDGVDWFLERIARVDAMIKKLVVQLESVGSDCILDLGFAKRERRDDFYAFAKAHNFPTTVHFLDTEYQVRKSRVVKRNIEKGDTFQFEVSESDFDFMESWFERPTASELKGAKIITDNL